LQKAVDEKMPSKASPQQVLQIVNNPQNAKAEEVKWSNIAGFLEGKKSVTKQEVLDYLKNEGAVKFEEVTQGDWGKAREKIYQAHDRGEISTEERNRQIDEVEKQIPRPTKFSQYTLPNGENYKEVVLTMPEADKNIDSIDIEIAKKKEYIQYLENGGDPVDVLSDIFNTQEKSQQEELKEARADLLRLESQRKQQPNLGYTSSHFSDIPNYVAHMRLNERPDSEGRNGLFIEELQSDRHQQGREKGYKDENQSSKLPEGFTFEKIQTSVFDSGEGWVAKDQNGRTVGTVSQTREGAEAQALRNINQDKQGIPDAPFRKDWSVQMFKRALRDAIASGKEWIGWTSGETQAERYDLSKQVRFIAYNKVGDKIGIIAKDHNFQTIIAKSYNPSELPDVIGKEVAQKIINGEGTEKKTELSNGDVINMKHLSGVDLKIGGEGMKGFYDQILPKEIGKYVKKWGAKVEEGDVKTDPKEYDTTPIWKVAITPEMRESIKRGGQIQFLPSRDGEEERITAATYTNPRTGKVTEGATHLIANPNAPQEATDRESPAYGFKTSSGGIVDRATAYQIAKDSGQLKAPTTEEEKFHADRGILHSGMYEPKGDISFPPSDDAHRAAVESGDTEEAQRLVDEVAKKAGYTIGPLWHGTSGDFYEFRPSGDEKAIFLSTDKNEAKAFATGKGGKVMGPLYVKATGPDKLYHATEEREAIQKARKKGYTGIKVTDQLPYSTYTMKPQRQIVNYAVFDPNQIKSSDPATYDKDGNLIPLSQRFNPTSSDIRFMPSSELPKTEDGAVDWESFKVKAQEISAPLANLAPLGGISFMPAKNPAATQTGYDDTYLKKALKAGKDGKVALTRPVRPDEALPLLSQRIPITGDNEWSSFAFDKAGNVTLYNHDGNSVTFKYDPALLAKPVFKDAAIEHAGKAVQLAMADRHTATGGDMGGILHPWLLSNINSTITGSDGKEYRVVWANNEWKPVLSMKNKAKKWGAYDLMTYLMGKDSHASNSRSVRTISNEIENAPITRQQKDLFLVLANIGITKQKAADQVKNIAKANKKIAKHEKILKTETDEKKVNASTNAIAAANRQLETAQSKLSNHILNDDQMALGALLTKYKTAYTAYKNGSRSEESFLKNKQELENYKKSQEFKNLVKDVHGKQLVNLDKTFKGRKSAIKEMMNVNLDGFDVNQILHETSDFENGRINHFVGSVELSRNPDLMAVYLGNDPKQAKRMTAQEAAAAAKLKADPNFVPHEAYTWAMLGPVDGNHFLNSEPATHLEYFPEFREQYAALKKDAKKRKAILNGSETTMMGAMRDTLDMPLVMKSLSDIKK